MSKRGFGVVLVFLVGCAVGGGASQLVPPASAQQYAGQKWDYYCFEESRADDVQPKAKTAGAFGWELAAVQYAVPTVQSVWCFKRPKM